MTVIQAIERFDNLYPNEFSLQEKVDWLNECDGLAYKEIMSNYEGVPEFNGHTNTNEELLISSPYDRLYESFMAWKMYLAREEIDRYNNFAGKYATEWQEWANYFNRTHRVEQKAVRYF